MRRGHGLAALALAVAAVLAPTAAADPGTPVSVLPGVPGNGRAWELVTPSEPFASTLFQVSLASSDGNRAVIAGVGALPGSTESTLVSYAMAERGAGGWTLAPLSFPDSESQGPLDSLGRGPQVFTPDLGASLWTNTLPLKPGETSGSNGLFRRLPGGGYAPLMDMGPEGVFIASTENLQRIVFSSDRHLLATDAGRTEGSSVYEIAGSTLRQLDLDGGGSLLSECGAAVAHLPRGKFAVSADLNRVYLATTGACGGEGDLFLREGSTTTKVTASHCTRLDCSEAGEIEVAAMTPSGSSAFFVTRRQLTDDDTDEIPDLYRYDRAGDELTRVSSPRTAPGPFGGTSSEGVRVSADGSRVYFEFWGQLLAGLGAGEEAANVYLLDDQGLHFVGPGGTQLWASADGRYAFLGTAAAIDPSDTDARPDIYRYDAQTHTIAGLSLAGNGDYDAILGDPREADREPLADGGRRVFITSAEQLLPQDHNNLEDVYEWANGSLSLVSAGESGNSSTFQGATGDGSTAFFSTTSTLLPRDSDGGDVDFYAARIGGGFAEPPTPPLCGGGSCRSQGGGGTRLTQNNATAAGGIRLRALDRATLKRIVASGWISLLVEVPRAGRLSAEAKARLGGATRTIAATDVKVGEPGPTRLRMRLSRKARGALATGADLRVRLNLHLAGLPKDQRANFKLKGTR